jgi:hypothetical protein
MACFTVDSAIHLLNWGREKTRNIWIASVWTRSRVGYSMCQMSRDKEDTRTRDELNCVDPSCSQQHTTNSASQVNLLRKQEFYDRVQETAAGPDPESSPQLHLQRPVHQIVGHIRFIFTSEIRPLSPHLHFTVLDKFQEVLKCVTVSSIDTLRLQSHLNPASADLNFIPLHTVLAV